MSVGKDNIRPIVSMPLHIGRSGIGRTAPAVGVFDPTQSKGGRLAPNEDLVPVAPIVEDARKGRIGNDSDIGDACPRP